MCERCLLVGTAPPPSTITVLFELPYSGGTVAASSLIDNVPPSLSLRSVVLLSHSFLCSLYSFGALSPPPPNPLFKGGVRVKNHCIFAMNPSAECMLREEAAIAFLYADAPTLRLRYSRLP